MSVYPRLYHPGPIEPVVDVGQNVLLQKPSLYELFQVQYIEALPPSAPITVNLATNGLAAATSSAGVSTGATPISLQNQEDMNNGELFQVRFRVLDPVSVALYQNQALGRGTTLYTQAVFNLQSSFRDPHATFTEHFVYEQNRAYMIATNYLSHALGQARVELWGYRYILGGVGSSIGSRGGRNSVPIASYNSVDEAIKNTAGFRFTIIPVQGWGA